MRALGLLMIGVGFLAGALVAVQSAANEVLWAMFVPTWVLCVAGVVLVRLRSRSARQADPRLQQGVGVLRDALGRVISNLMELNREKAQLHPMDVHGRIDELFRADLERFVEARYVIARQLGLPAFAAVMNEFAAGERYLNRVWSASVDGYVDEVSEYLDRALEQFRRALQELEERSGPAVDPVKA